MKIGVLALQGDFREHIKSTQSLGHTAVEVRRIDELNDIDALILPGGESTAIVHLAKSFQLFEPLRSKIKSGLPVYGSCAGMILLSDRILGAAPDQETFGGIDMTVRRNAFGRQIDSFESDIDFNGSSIHAVFIRAPWVEEVSEKVTVLSSVTTASGDSHPVAIRQGSLFATSFHPELTQDLRVHEYFFDEICQGR